MSEKRFLVKFNGECNIVSRSYAEAQRLVQHIITSVLNIENLNVVPWDIIEAIDNSWMKKIHEDIKKQIEEENEK